ncbi:MAG: DUF6455 family protein [Aliishimia sp.]
MEFFRKLSESASLVSGMAERLDADISGRIASNPETAARSYVSMVRRCANCSNHEACAELQDASPALDAAPDYCLNKDAFVPAKPSK